VALLVVILGAPSTPVAALTDFRHLWVYAASTALACGFICVLLKGKPRRPASVSLSD
jgi:hypothetical protein